MPRLAHITESALSKLEFDCKDSATSLDCTLRTLASALATRQSGHLCIYSHSTADGWTVILVSNPGGQRVFQSKASTRCYALAMAVNYVANKVNALV